MDKLKAMAEALGTGISNQWDKGRPFREMMGKGLNTPSGNPVGRWAQGVAQRTLHPLEAMAQASNDLRTTDPVELGLNWSNPVAGGLVGMFAGRGAKTADVAKLALAEKLKVQGIPDEQIWKETGWTFGFPDQKPRFEIPDGAAKFKGFSGKQANISDAVEHPDLYSAYDMKKMQIYDDSTPHGSLAGSGSKGSYHQDSDRISLGNTYGMDEAKSTTLHELQHAIQQREGFARGGSPESFMRDISNQRAKFDDNINFINQELSKAAGTPRYNELLNMRQDLVEKMRNQGLDDVIGMRESAHNQYKRLAGEAEARLTQARMNMTAPERAASYPPLMFDVPVEQQIVRY